MSVAVPQPETNAFRVVDSGEFRSDLALRREAKYALHGTDVGKVRDVLAGNLRRQIHNERVSRVRSIYFDDPGLSCCRANLAGLPSRRKLRVRWYDSPLPGTSFFLEVKWRENQITGKRRQQIQTDRPLTEFRFREIIRQIGECVADGDRILAWQLIEPIVTVEYCREHFVSSDGELRFTLDYDLQFVDQTGRNQIASGFATEASSFVLIEGKFPPGQAAEVQRLLHPLAPRISSSSKYVLGCELLGLV
ncbi:MAG: polyphosphate polymerase domain-containing protein [Planctomycetes bacterium]|nr:polyphosphate polymerase domain-containing protein [Planctomycetota bacterium]